MNSGHIIVFFMQHHRKVCRTLKFNYIIASATAGRRAETMEVASLTTDHTAAEKNRQNHKLYHDEASTNEINWGRAELLAQSSVDERLNKNVKLK